MILTCRVEAAIGSSSAGFSKVWARGGGGGKKNERSGGHQTEEEKSNEPCQRKVRRERERERERENPDRSRNHLTRYLLPRSPVLVGQRGKRQGAIFGIYTLSYSSCMRDGPTVSAIYPATDLSAVPHCLMLTPKLLAPGCLVKVRSGRLFHSSWQQTATNGWCPKTGGTCSDQL